MTRRALIVAIESYDRTPPLEGTERGAALFREWLIHTRGFSPEAILACAGPHFPGRTHGTARDDVVSAVNDLTARGRDRTEELHVFLSGLGAEDQATIVARDGAALAIADLETRLLAGLGPGRHHVWVDVEARSDAEPPLAPFPLKDEDEVVRSRRGVPTLHTIASATHAAWPRIVGAFARVRARRVDALGGVRAGVETHMYVTWDVLATLMQKHASEDETLLLDVHPLATQGLGEAVEGVPSRGYAERAYALRIQPAGRTLLGGRALDAARVSRRGGEEAPIATLDGAAGAAEPRSTRPAG
jgi:hypothetical protein